MEIEMNDQERDMVKYISRRNWNVYAVGGGIRDTLLGKSRGDLDIVVEASQFRELVQHLKQRYVVLRDGIPYKTAKVVLDHGSKRVVDVTVPRGEIYPGPADDPVEYEVGEISRDLSRRDFTINSMALRLNGGQQNLLDAFGGERDLRNGIIRFVGDPDKRIEEDPLRMLRAVRFASVLGFRMEPNTFEAVCRNAQQLKLVSRERVRDEMVKASPAFKKFFDGVVSIGAADVIFGISVSQWEGVKHDSRGHHYGESLLQHTEDMLKYIEGNEWSSGELVPFEVKLAAVYHDSGKIASMAVDENKITFHDHPKFSKAFAGPIIRNFHFSRERENHIMFLIAGHMRFASVDNQRPSTIAKHIVDARLEHIPLQWLLDLATLSKADGHAPPSPELMKSLYEVERPRPGRLLELPPERRKDAVRSMWIEDASKIVKEVKA